MSYSLAEAEIQKPPTPIPFRIKVATFKDARSEDEKIGEGKGKGLMATRDRFFQNVPEGITSAVVEHVRRNELFLEVSPAAFSSAEFTAERLELLQSEADAVLIGTIAHFYGIVHRSQAIMAGMAGAAGVAGGLIGGLFVAGIESTISKDVEGHAALIDLELLDAKTGESKWKGVAEAHFKRTERGLPEAADAALEALKTAVTKLVDQLRELTHKPTGNGS